MGSPLVELVPFAAGLAVTPAAIATGILFLSSKRPLGNAIAFSAAFSLVDAGVAAVVLGFAQAATGPLIGQGTRHRLILAIGLLLLALALVLWLLLGGLATIAAADVSTAARSPGRCCYWPAPSSA